MSYSKPGDEKYQAAWTPDEAEVTIVRDAYAGISGPAGSYEAATLTDAAKVLFEEGFLIAGSWEVSRLGDYWAPLTRMF